MKQLWPLAGLRVQTPRLELRLPSESDLEALASVAADGVHDPDVMPFTVAWTDAAPAERARSVLQYHWRQRGAWAPAKWSLDLVAVHDGSVVGTQAAEAADFATLREVGTGSWLGLAHHGQGIGTEMRAAVLHLAFAGLGAEYATSGAFDDNLASRRVSGKLGYADDGTERHVRRGQPATVRRFRLDRATWAATRAVPVTLVGLKACLPMFGVAESGDDD